MHQLKCFAMMDTIHIRKLGYPIRHSLEDFLNRYRVLLDTTACDPRTVRPDLIDSYLPVYLFSLPPVIPCVLAGLPRGRLLPAVRPSAAPSLETNASGK